MVGIQIKIRYLILTLILIIGSATVHSLNLNVVIAESAEHRTVDLQQNKNFSNLHGVNFTVENTGSIGCVYRARTLYKYGNSTIEDSWSQGYSLWPGETDRVSTVNVIDNRSELVNVTVTLNYCGSTKKVESFNTRIDTEPVEAPSRNNLVVEIGDKSSKVYLEQDADLLVPVKSPNLWKLSHVDVNNRQAKIRYDPPIFKKRTLEYYLVEDGEIIGKTEVDLGREKTLSKRIQILIRRLQLNV